MRRALTFAAVVFGLLLMGIIFGQAQEQPPVRLIAQIGEARPRRVIYDPNFDRMAYVDARGQLVLADATTYTPQVVLHDTGLYNAYRFSHDGLWLALAIETRVEIYDTSTGEVVSEIAPDGAVIAEGPLYWAEDDELLSFNAQVRAPQELRRSENDTVNLPYIWDWQATRRARATILPNRVVAQPFYDYRNGFAFGPHGTFIIGLPQRLEVHQIGTDGYPVIGEIESTRNEPDPISVWASAFDDMLYIEARGQNNLFQIDTAGARIIEIPTNQTFSRREDLPDIVGSDVFHIIGGDHTLEIPELLREWLGAPESGRWDVPHTIELVDILLPETPQAAQPIALLKSTAFDGLRITIYYYRVPIPYAIALHPDGSQITLRHTDDEGRDRLDTYSLVTGNWLHSITPSLSEYGRSQHLLAYDRTGTVLLNDYQRYDAQTGDLLSENLELNYGYDQFYFPQATGQIVTINDQGRWVWDFYTEEVVNQLSLEPRGDVVEVTPDQSRYLSRITVEGQPGYEIYDVASGDRRRVFFDEVPQRQRLAEYYSPSWENYLVVYGDLDGQAYQPTGNAIALYTMGQGMRWLIADDDLPFTGQREYGWLDDETIYIHGIRGIPEQPERIYGIDYDGSGLPTCLVEAFPETHQQWVGYWDSLVWRMRPDDLNRLAVRLCQALPTDETGVNTIFFPTPTPTRLPVSPTPAGIAGVPACLTNYFPNEAREYAAVWREVIAGLTPEEIEAQEKLLCESLRGESIAEVQRLLRDPNVEVMLIDINTQIRRVGGFIPSQPPQPRDNIELVAESMRLAGMAVPNALQFSLDGRYIAGVDSQGFIEIYEMLQPYTAFAADATATAVGFEPTDVKHISLLPTPTRGFDAVGKPRPTLTPTVTQTPPPTIAATAAVAQRVVVEDLCPVERIYTMDDLPPEWAVTGRILLHSSGIPESPLLVLQPEDGSIERDYNSLDCANCEHTYDLNWVRQGSIISRPDGSGAFNLEDLIEALAPEIFNPREDGTKAYLAGEDSQLTDMHFIDLHTVQYAFRVYDTANTRRPVTEYTQRLDLETGEVVSPYQPTPSAPIVIDYRSPDYVSVQNNADPEWMIVRLPYHTGTGDGSRYYLYHLPTHEARYLTSVSGNTGLDIQWHPLGKALYFRYPGGANDEWFRLDAATGEVGLLGTLPDGVWSRDARYRFTPYTPPQEEYRALEEAGEINHFFRIWDSETGLTRHFCVPLYTDFSTQTIRWSPDNRYVLIRGGYTIPPETEEDQPVYVSNYLLFDTATGSITELTNADLDIIIWTQDEEQSQ